MEARDRKLTARKVLFSALAQIEETSDRRILYPWRCHSLDEEAADIIRDNLRQKFPDVDDSIVDDFRMHNMSKVPLDQIYGHLEWPQSASERTALLVSAPGFSKNGLHAMISIGIQFGSLAGSGACYLYSKTQEEWIKRAELMVWIS